MARQKNWVVEIVPQKFYYTPTACGDDPVAIGWLPLHKQAMEVNPVQIMSFLNWNPAQAKNSRRILMFLILMFILF